MQNHILKAHPHTRLAVYALWTDKLSGDSRSQWTGDGLVDRRVVHLWDAKDTAGDWLTTHIPASRAGDWDAYFLFGPNAVWTATPHPLLSSGSTVIGSNAQLQAAILPLLNQKRGHAGGLP